VAPGGSFLTGVTMLPVEGLDSREDGNEQVVKMLEEWTVQAKLGRMNFVALVGCEGLKQVTHGYAGAAGLEFGVNWGLDCLKRRLYDRKEERSCPRDQALTADYACFNLMDMAPSFDFMNWLAIAEMTRRKEGAPAPLKVGFWKGRIAETWQEGDRRPGMFENVVRPALKLIGAVEDEAAIPGRQYTSYLLNTITTAVRSEGVEVPIFRATDEARAIVDAVLRGARPVVITLREANHWPHRNSNLDEWLKFARFLERAGEQVIFVRDTAKSDQSTPGYEFQIWPDASKNIDIRLALYEASKCSLFAANGPWNLAVFAQFPWLMFNEALENDPFEFNRPEGWRMHNGIGPGEQLPWSRADQRIIWAKDNYASMAQAWDAIQPLLQEREAA
jgi:hypothetical protein